MIGIKPVKTHGRGNALWNRFAARNTGDWFKTSSVSWQRDALWNEYAKRKSGDWFMRCI